MEKIINTYNNFSDVPTQRNYPEILNVADACAGNSVLFCPLDGVSSLMNVPYEQQMVIIENVNLIMRAEEEKRFVKEDMEAVYTYFCDLHENVLASLPSDSNSRLGRGCKSLVLNETFKLEVVLFSLKHHFSNHVSLKELNLDLLEKVLTLPSLTESYDDSSSGESDEEL